MSFYMMQRLGFYFLQKVSESEAHKNSKKLISPTQLLLPNTSKINFSFNFRVLLASNKFNERVEEITVLKQSA